MGVRKEDMAMESSVDQPYFSVSTEQRFLWKRKEGCSHKVMLCECQFAGRIVLVQ